jgi:hypothetical protein
MKGLLGIVGIMLVAGCAGVPPAAVRDWSSHNFGNYRKLVDEKFPGDGSQDTRLNSYKSMASLICTADTADKKQDASKACKCQNATSDADLKTNCTAFIQDYN